MTTMHPGRTQTRTIVRAFVPTIQLAAIRAGFAVLEPVAPRAASWWALRLWTTLPRNGGRRRDERPHPGTASAVSVDGRTVVVETWGEGPPVYLVHGWGGWRGQLGRFVDPFVRAGRTVVAFDAPGHGSSDPGGLGPGRGNALELARSLAAVSAVHGEPEAVIAHSLGCATSVVALRDGLGVGRLVCVAPSVDAMVSVSGTAQLLGFGRRTTAALIDRIENLAGRPLSDFDPSTYGDVPPTLIVHDRRDKEVPYEQAERLARAWPSADLVTTDGLGHQRILRDQSVIERVVEFVAG
ncbi:alpha/beta fold hydrolase [Georgenia deserti]|uniref:Alpha/beta fold hydrolase n=1 Tax=Georgenia deserti TaxID=2093781 RepID=A0ABW4L3I1_9MICO